MRHTDQGRSAPNYISACVVMFGVNVLWVFMLIWAIWGLPAVMLTGWAVKIAIDRIGARHRN